MNKVVFYKSKLARLPGTSYKEVYGQAFLCYRKIKKRSKRQPYVKSTYFSKQKVFLNLFWRHLDQKNWRDRVRRLRYLPVEIDLLRHTRLNSFSVQNPNRPSETFHRFFGCTSDGYRFIVQVKEVKKSGKKYFISIFPYNDN